MGGKTLDVPKEAGNSLYIQSVCLDACLLLVGKVRGNSIQKELTVLQVPNI